MKDWLPILCGFLLGHTISSVIYFLWAAHHTRKLTEVLKHQIQVMEVHNMMLGAWVDREHERDNL